MDRGIGRHGVPDLRDADRVMAPHPRGLGSAPGVRPGGAHLERRQSGPLCPGQGMERGRSGGAGPTGRRRPGPGCGIRLRHPGGVARQRGGGGRGRHAAQRAAAPSRARRPRRRRHGPGARLAPDRSVAGPRGERDSSLGAAGPVRRPRGHPPHGAQLGHVRGGTVDARAGTHARRPDAPAAHHGYRCVHPGLHSRPAGPVRAGRGRGPRAGAGRLARAVRGDRRRGRRERRVAGAPYLDRGCGRGADAPAPAPSTGVRPVSHPEPATPRLPPPPYEPRRPALIATAAFTLWPVLLSLPMVAGMWLASQWSDQYTAGLPFHAWSAAWFKRTGHLPLWNPEIFGGLPFVAAGSGDVFYPTWLLRFVVPVTTAGNLSFFVHYVLAGLFTYLLLRRLQVGWTGSVVGGLAYELSGLIASYPSPGHDGKLFASTMLPLMLLALVLALRDRRWQGYPLLAAATALTLLGHFQLAYYSLIVAGLFALYLTLEEERDSGGGKRVLHLGLALVAVLIGFGVAAIQILPFFEYIPFSPRAQGYHGFEGSTSFAIPWDHVPEFFFKNFVGSRETYWGSNPIKLHSEYLGLPVVVLAALGATVREHRRQILWLGGIGLLFLLVSLGGATPFYKLWWAVMPLVKKTRAPGMAFFVVAFVTAVWAGVGAERALSSEGRRAALPALVVAACVVLLAVFGVFGHVAHALADGLQAEAGRATGAAAEADQTAILWGALGSGIALAIAAALFGLASGRLALGV